MRQFFVTIPVELESARIDGATLWHLCPHLYALSKPALFFKRVYLYGYVERLHQTLIFINSIGR